MPIKQDYQPYSPSAINRAPKQQQMETQSGVP